MLVTYYVSQQETAITTVLSAIVKCYTRSWELDVINNLWSSYGVDNTWNTMKKPKMVKYKL